MLLTRLRQLRKSPVAAVAAMAVTPPWHRRRLSDRLAAMVEAGWRWKLPAILAPLLVIALGVYYYNTFVALQQDVTTARAQVDSSVQMRRNIVPVLRAVVGELLGHEEDIFRHTVDARADSVSGRRHSVPNVTGAAGNTAAGGEFGQLLSKLLAIFERYPDITAAEPFQLLMGQLTEVERTVLDKRLAYNEAVNIYNARVTRFPGRVFARVFGFGPAEWFERAAASEWSAAELQGMPARGEKQP